MAKITKHGGVSDALAPKDDSVSITRGAAPGTPGHTEYPKSPEYGDVEVTDLSSPEEPEGEQNGDESVPSEETTDGTPQLPPTNALKSVWAETLADVGVAREWIDGEGRTKEDLVATGRGIADGSLVVVDGEPVPAGE